MCQLRNQVTSQIDARALAATRIMVGIAAVIRGIIGWNLLESVFDPAHCQMPQFDWMPTPGITEIRVIALTWLALAALMILGAFTRIAAIGLAMICGAIMVLDVQLYESNLYLLAVLCLVLGIGDSGAAWSIDSLFRQPRPLVMAWPATLLKIQLSIVYGFAALAKFNPVYGSGVVLSLTLRKTGFMAIPESWHTPEVMGPLAISAIGVELFLALAFWAPAWRRVAVFVGLAMHAGFVGLMVPEVAGRLVVFALEMIAIYPLFFATIVYPASETDDSRAA